MTEVTPVDPRAISRRGTAAVTLSTAVSALSGYVILLISARSLGPAGYAEFSVFWSLYFALLGTLFGLQQEATRAASATWSAPADRTPAGRVRIVRGCVLLGVAFGLGLMVTSPAWSPTVFSSHELAQVAMVAAAAMLYAAQTGLLGTLGGRRRWGTVSAIITTEAVLRLSGIALAALAGWGLVGMSAATAAAAVGWIGVSAFSPATRKAWGVRGDTAARAFVARSSQAMVAAAATSLLVMGFPTLMAATTPEGLGEAGGVLILAVTLTRAPLLVPMFAFQGVAIAYFVSRRGAGLRAVAKPALALVGIGAVGSGAAWLVGAQIMTTFFGPGFDIAPAVLAALTAAATVMAVLTLTGSAVLADERHRAFVAGWLTAGATSVVLLLVLPASLTARTILSLSVGPLVGIALHLAVLGRARPVAERPAVT